MNYSSKMSKEILVDSSSIYLISPFTQAETTLSGVFSELNFLLKDICFPIGTIIYLSEDINPSDYFPGNWEIFSEGQTLISTSTDVFAQGGEYTHTLTVAEMPAHSHQITYTKTARSTNEDVEYGGASGTTQKTSATGSAYGHNNIMPCSAHYCWRRVN